MWVTKFIKKENGKYSFDVHCECGYHESNDDVPQSTAYLIRSSQQAFCDYCLGKADEIKVIISDDGIRITLIDINGNDIKTGVLESKDYGIISAVLKGMKSAKKDNKGYIQPNFITKSKLAKTG